MSTQLKKNDDFLNLLVKTAENDVSIDVTLNVNGLVVSGKLISQKRYYEEVARSIRNPFSNNVKEDFSGILDSLSMLGDLPNGSSTEEDGSTDYEFVHLSDAHCYVGDTSIPTGSAPWRGKMTEIDGFMLG